MRVSTRTQEKNTTKKFGLGFKKFPKGSCHKYLLKVYFGLKEINIAFWKQ